MPSMICRLPVPNLEGAVSPKALDARVVYGSTKVVLVKLKVPDLTEC